MGDIHAVKGLIAFGAKVNCKNAFGQTPLDLARMHFHKEIIGLLESVGGESGLSTKLGGPGTPVWGEAVTKDSIARSPPQRQQGKKNLLLFLLLFVVVVVSSSVVAFVF